MKRLIPSLIVLFFSAFIAHAQSPGNDSFLLHLMKRHHDQFQYFIDHSNELEIQIIYTQINRDANNVPAFKSFYYNIDTARYFYPASTIKLPVVLEALEKVRALNYPGLTKFSTMLSDSVYSGQLRATKDTTSESGLPSIAHYIRKILVASDNDAYNRLYEFLGQEKANTVMRKKGYHIRLLHRLERSLTPDENRHTEPVRFLSRDSSLLYSQPMQVGDSIPVRQTVLKGQAYYSKNILIHQPFNFSYKNFYPLVDQQLVLRALLFPSSVTPEKRFAISESDRSYVLKYMSQLPTETSFPDYKSDTAYYPAFSKYLLFGNDRDSIPRSLRIFNKIGDAYGYLVDNAYVVDFDHRVEFMLSAVIFANEDGIFNDSDYEYKTIGFPFMKELGKLIYHYELKRSRHFKPDLSEFRFHYDN